MREFGNSDNSDRERGGGEGGERLSNKCGMLGVGRLQRLPVGHFSPTYNYIDLKILANPITKANSGPKPKLITLARFFTQTVVTGRKYATGKVQGGGVMSVFQCVDAKCLLVN